MEIKDQVRAFITSNFYVADPATLSDDVSLLDRGIIDSTGVLEVIFFIEETFGIKVEDSEMLPDNLDSIDRISNFITRKLA
ncbi:MAG: acyl carrier protein [Gammaproteobacteria bacterium]|nr:acyl carrier protein [Gammaproteobacteria bacterium]MBU1969744.1 acyl carrier protein [Gammaproteobacteria bacterium]